MYLRIAEYVGIALAVIFLITQLILPAVRGQRLLPMFRTQGKLESVLAEVTQEQKEEEVLDEIARKMAGEEMKKQEPKRKTKKRN